MEILIDNRSSHFTLEPNIEKLIEDVCATTLKHLNKDEHYEISISFVENEEIKNLNKIYRDNDTITDVLSFPMEDDLNIDFENVLLGDVVISVDRIKEQAVEYGHSFERELAYLLVHSLLHLFGFDHLVDHEKDLMRIEEKAIMDKLRIYKD
jgi:probable rRNA maturation factor